MNIELSGRGVKRIAGTLLIMDGLAAIGLGRHYVRFWQFGPKDHPWRQAMDWLAERPPWQIRLAGLAEMGVGIGLVASSPLSPRELRGPRAVAYARAETVSRRRMYPDAYRAFDRAVVTHLAPDGDVLDIGCGIGANLYRLIAMGQPFGSYTGIDLTEAVVADARARSEGRDNVHFLPLDVETNPLPEGPFDLVISTWRLDQLSRPAGIVQEAWARLRPGGHILLLYDIATGAWWETLAQPLLRYFGAGYLSEELYFQFPGLVGVSRYQGALGEVALVTLHKPAQPIESEGETG